MASDAERDYWQAVARKVGERCDFYGAEELATFVEGKLRGRNARALAAHVRDCGDCGGVVEELRRELAPEPVAVRVRFAPARGWAWALAGSAVAAVVIAAVVLRPGGGIAPTPGVSPRPAVSVAEVPTEVGEQPVRLAPREAPVVLAVTPKAPERKAVPVRRHPGSRRHEAGRPVGVGPQEAMVASGAGAVNVLPEAAALAFGEPPATAQMTTAEVEELLRQGAVNDLPEDGAEPLDEALVGEFYQGFDELVQDLETEGEGAGQ